ncbi:MAG: hypothetical protein KDA96_03660, partial [Planctomycetaceae bacterium]|nr:hypothetical protein [Planctomycetaceae bacterium]
MTFRIWKHTLALALVALLATPCLAQKGGKGGGGSSGGGGTTGPKFAIEVLSFSGFVRDFNDQGDVLGEIYDSNNDSYTYFLGTVDSGVRVFEEIRVPAGWQVRLWAMNNARQLVGQGSFDPDGDGLDANGDYVLDDGDILNAGIVLTPDTNNDGRWELTNVFPGPLDAVCEEINNDGDIVGYDESLGRVLLR